MNDLLDALGEATRSIQSSLDSGPLRGTSPTPCTSYDLTALVDHINWTHGLLLEAIGGRAPAEADHRATAAAVLAAWAERGIGGTISIGGNDLPASFGLHLHILEAYVHGWDLSRASSTAFVPSPELTEIAWEAARVIVTDDARGPGGPYGAAIDVPADAGDIDRLIAFTGRDPSWSPPPPR